MQIFREIPFIKPHNDGQKRWKMSVLRTTDHKASGYEQMQTIRQMQKGCPNQASYQAGMKQPIKKKEYMVGKKRKKRNRKQKN